MLIAILFMLGAHLPSSFAQATSTGGGGDPCWDEINQKRLMIRGWIERDEAKSLNLENGWSYNGDSASKSYKSSMLRVLGDQKVIFTCYLNPSKKMDEHALKVSKKYNIAFKSLKLADEEFACFNYRDKSTGVRHFDCDYDKLINPNVSGDRIIRLVHHEFALHAGVEKKDGKPFSDFFVSDQVALYSGLQSVWVLGPNKREEEQVEESQQLEVGWIRNPFLSTASNKYRCAAGLILGALSDSGFKKNEIAITSVVSMNLKQAPGSDVEDLLLHFRGAIKTDAGASHQIDAWINAQWNKGKFHDDLSGGCGCRFNTFYRTYSGSPFYYNHAALVVNDSATQGRLISLPIIGTTPTLDQIQSDQYEREHPVEIAEQEALKEEKIFLKLFQTLEPQPRKTKEIRFSTCEMEDDISPTWVSSTGMPGFNARNHTITIYGVDDFGRVNIWSKTKTYSEKGAHDLRQEGEEKKQLLLRLGDCSEFKNTTFFDKPVTHWR